MRYLVPLLIVLFFTASVVYLYTFDPPRSSSTEDSDRSEVSWLMKKDVESWTEEETETFLRLKESQYSVMRDRVRKFCLQSQVKMVPQSLSLFITHHKKEHFSNGTSRMALVYDEKDKVSYCAIPKVASSTWCWHFIKLGKQLFNLLL